MSSPAETPLPWSSSDFPDWLSPMLVKELRQGVRTRVFVALFILLQVAMLLTVSLTLLVAAHGEDTSAGTWFFWIFVALPVLVVLPLNGLNAINGEIRANTLELIFLTRLTAFRIVAGKWLAIFVQSLLFVCAVLPYLVLRYFIGGINLAVELAVLGSMLVGSAVFSAFATGLSAYPVRVVRAVSILLVVLFFVVLSVGGELVGRGSVTGPGLGLVGVVEFLVCAGIVLLLMLEVGAARIAPSAENHSAVIRLLAAGGLLAALALSFFTHDAMLLMILAIIIAVLVCLFSLCEEPRWVPRLFRPFATRGWIGRLVGRLFYPGWYTAAPFTLLVFAVSGWLLARAKLLEDADHLVWFVALVGALLLPVALIRTFLPGTKRATLFFLVFQILCSVATISFLIWDTALRTHTRDLIAFLPLASLMMGASDNVSEANGRLVAVSCTTGLSLLLLTFAVLRTWGQARQAENQSLQPAATPPAVSNHGPLA